jgi:hypothetical protein
MQKAKGKGQKAKWKKQNVKCKERTPALETQQSSENVAPKFRRLPPS